MPNKLTKAEANAAAQERRIARYKSLAAERTKVVSDAIRTLRPGFEMYTHEYDLPRWLSRLLGKCEGEARTEVNTEICYHNEIVRNTEDEEIRNIAYCEAYIPEFAKTFPRLLAKALAQYEAKKGQPHMVRKEKLDAAKNHVVCASIRKLRPDLEIEYICGGLPLWFSRILRKCEGGVAWRICDPRSGIGVPPHGCVDKETRELMFDEASIRAFAEMFPKLLEEALATHDALGDQPPSAA
jgi:hypothetical protein